MANIENMDDFEKLDVLQKQVYGTGYRVQDVDYIIQLANTERLMQYAPKLRDWLLGFCNAAKKYHSGKGDAKFQLLKLDDFDNAELVLSMNESWALMAATTTPHNEAFLYNLARYITAEVGTRLLNATPEYAGTVPSLLY